MSSPDTEFTLAVQRFVRRDIEYRLVENLESGTNDERRGANIYEYNRLTGPDGVPARKYSEGGIADGFVEIGRDGDPSRPPVSYVVLDQHILQDRALLVGDITDVPLPKRDYGYYKKALNSLRSLDRVNVLKQGQSVEVISGGRKYVLDFSENVIIYDGADGELFSYADVVAGQRTYSGVEIKVDPVKNRAYIYDRQYGKGEVADLPVRSVDDITDPEKRVQINLKQIADLSRELAIEQKSEGKELEKSPQAIIVPPMSIAGQDRAKPAPKSFLERISIAQPKVPAREPISSRLPITKPAKVAVVVPPGPPTDDLPRPINSTAISARGMAELKRDVGDSLRSAGAARALGDLMPLFENKRKDGGTERAYEHAHGKARIVFVYPPQGHVRAESVQTTEFVYPGSELTADWEGQVENMRKKNGKFSTDDREQDLIAAKRAVVDNARAAHTYKKIIAAMPDKAKETVAVKAGLDQLIKDTADKYGKVLK